MADVLKDIYLQQTSGMHLKNIKTSNQQFREEYRIVGDVVDYYPKLDRHLFYIYQFMAEIPRPTSSQGYYYISLFDNSITTPKNICGVVCYLDKQTNYLWADSILLYAEAFKPYNIDKKATIYTICADKVLELGKKIKAHKVIVICTKEYESAISYKLDVVSQERLLESWKNKPLPHAYTLREKVI